MIREKQRSLNEWLVIRAQQGDRASFNTLLKHWQPRYYLYALRRLESPEAARDTTQECLLSISRGLHGLADPRAFPKWGFRILERRCSDCLRKTLRDGEFITPMEELPAVTDPGGETGYDVQATVAVVLHAMDSRLAAVLRLYYLEKLPVMEIAEVLNVPPGTVKSRLFYGRKLFIDAMNEKGGDSND